MMNNILAAVDFSSISQAVVDRAAELAAHDQARVWLVHAAAPEPDFVGYDPGPASVRDSVAEHLREEHRSLQAMAAELRERGFDATALLIQGPTIEVVLGEARKISADVIVVGSHGHGAVHRALLGSVSEGVLRKTEVPVLVVPARAAG
jgi:nucleotide-binding universal stress UspA family protein